MSQLALQDGTEQARSAWFAVLTAKARVRRLVAVTLLVLAVGLGWLGLRQQWFQLDTEPHICTAIIAVVLLAMLGTISSLEQRMHCVEAMDRRFNHLFEATPGCSVLVMDGNGRIRSVNGFAAEMFGFEPGSLLGLPCSAILPQGTPGNIDADQGRLQEHIGRRRDGSDIFLEIGRSSAVMADGDRLTTLIIRDISGKRRFQQAQWEREAHLGLMVEQMPAILWTTDHDLHITSSMGAGLAALNLKADEIIRLTMSTKLDHRTQESTRITAYHDALRGKSVSYEMGHKDHVFQVRIDPLRNTDKAITGTIGIMLDITDRKKTMRELQDRARQQAAVARLGQEALSDKSLKVVLDAAVSLVQQTLCVDYCCVAIPLQDQPGARMVSGLGWNARFPVGTVLDESIDSLIAHTLENQQSVCLINLPKDDRFRGSKMLEEHDVSSGLNFLLRGKTKIHGVICAFSKTPRSFSQNDANFLHAVANILAACIEQSTAEELRLSLEERLRQSQKMEAVGRLAGGIAHDFNNLLCVIGGYSEIYLGKLRPDESLHEPLTEIHKAAQRAAGLTRQLLAFSRKQVMVPRILCLNALVTETQRMLARTIGEDIELATLLDSNLNEIKADSTQIEQVLLNLAVNARDAMPSGGKLTIQTSNVLLTRSDLRNHHGIEAGSYVLLEVRDTGCGMDETTKSHIFEPFFTTKEQGKGTGLGLATVYGIVKQSGGHIEVESAPGKGTLFSIFFRRFEDTSPVEARPPLAAVPRGTETILLVEDEDGVRKMTRQILEARGFTVLEAQDGAEAIHMIEGHSDNIDLLLTDVVMPHMGGPCLAQAITNKRPRTKVLFMSGYTDSRLIRHGIGTGEVDCIFKPFVPDTLTTAVRAALDRKTDVA